MSTDPPTDDSFAQAQLSSYDGPTLHGGEIKRDPPDDQIDPGIRYMVRVFQAARIETFQSCQGGEGHSFPEPTIQFEGSSSVGFFAVHVALTHGFPFSDLRRVWKLIDGELEGPIWEMVFHDTVPPARA